MITKLQKATTFFTSGMTSEALRIFRTFKDRHTPEELRHIEIAHESLTGKSSFYRQLGIDTDQVTDQAKEIIINKFGIKTS